MSVQAAQTPRAVTFQVHDVQPIGTLLKTVKTHEALRALLRTSAPANSRNQLDQPLIACCDYTTDCVANSGAHPLIEAAHLAFSKHRPLILSPDMLWITILQGLSQHVRNNPDTVRSRLVSHQGKATIGIGSRDLLTGSPEDPWREIVTAFANGLSRNVGPKYDQLVSNFSTTGRDELIACQVALMDLFSPFFDYLMVTICGIPQLTLEGEVGDWKRLRSKIDLLDEFDLGWWADILRPICKQFIRASQGDVDLSFWRDIIKREVAYGANRLNGWLIKFILFVIGPNQVYNQINPLLKDPEQFVTSKALPSGVSTVHLDYDVDQSNSGSPIPVGNYELAGGFVGIAQDATTMALRPKLGWGVRKGTATHDLYRMIDKFKPAPPHSTDEIAQILKGLRPDDGRFSGPSWSSEFRQLYAWCDGVTLFPGRHEVRIRPLAECEFFKNPPIYDPESDDVNTPSPLSGDPWLVFADFPDHTFAAIHLYPTSTDGGRGYHWQIIHGGKRAERRGGVPIVANSLNEFLKLMLINEGIVRKLEPLANSRVAF